MWGGWANTYVMGAIIHWKPYLTGWLRCKFTIAIRQLLSIRWILLRSRSQAVRIRKRCPREFPRKNRTSQVAAGPSRHSEGRVRRRHAPRPAERRYSSTPTNSLLRHIVPLSHTARTNSLIPLIAYYLPYRQLKAEIKFLSNTFLLLSMKYFLHYQVQYQNDVSSHVLSWYDYSLSWKALFVNKIIWRYAKGFSYLRKIIPTLW